MEKEYITQEELNNGVSLEVAVMCRLPERIAAAYHNETLFPAGNGRFYIIQMVDTITECVRVAVCTKSHDAVRYEEHHAFINSLPHSGVDKAILQRFVNDVAHTWRNQNRYWFIDEIVSFNVPYEWFALNNIELPD